MKRTFLVLFVAAGYLILALAACAINNTKTAPSKVSPAVTAQPHKGGAELGQPTPVEQPQLHNAIKKRHNVLLTKPPQKWPKDLAWRPLRHFGPFYYGSEFAQIQVRLTGASAIWYFNDFFATCTDASWYTQYFAGNLPATPTSIPSTPPSTQYIPGQFRGSDGIHDLLFGLDSVELSSQFGGSVKLSFQTIEDYEYEVQKGQIIWDVRSIEMIIFVTPRAEVFNQPNRVNYSNNLSVVFVPHDPIAYDISGSAIALMDDPKIDELQDALQAAASLLISQTAFANTASKFVHGFLHGQLQNEIGASEIVTMIEVRDGFIDAYTQNATPMFSISLRLHPIHVDDEQGFKNVTGDIFAEHVFTLPRGSDDNPVFGYEFAVASGDSTTFRSSGFFNLQECTELQEFLYMVSATGWGGLFTDPRTGHLIDTVSIDCNVLQSRQNASNYGVVSRRTQVENFPISDSQGQFGRVTVESQISLFLR